MFNNISIEGRLTQDPDLRRLPSGLAVCNITVACDRSIKKDGKQALFIGAKFFGNQADNVAKYFRKGRAIIVTGRLENDDFTDKETGEKRTIYFIQANAFDFPLSEGSKEKAQADGPAPIADSSPIGAIKENGGLDSIEVTDDDLPF